MVEDAVLRSREDGCLVVTIGVVEAQSDGFATLGSRAVRWIGRCRWSGRRRNFIIKRGRGGEEGR